MLIYAFASFDIAIRVIAQQTALEYSYKLYLFYKAKHNSFESAD